MEEGLTLHKEKKEWRDMFTTPLLEKALAITRIAEIDLDDSDELVTATIRSKREFHVAISRAPASYDEEWNPDNFTCDCMTKTRVRIWRLGQYSYHYVCQHMAAALLFWEKKHGPWYFPEPEERRLAREEARRAAREAAERKRREEAERARIRQEQEERKRALEEEREKLTAIFRPAGDFFPEPTPGDIFFDIKSITARANCNEYVFRRAHELLRTECITMNDPSITYSPRGEQMLNCAASVEDGDRSYSCRVAFTAHELVECRCHCNPSGWFYQKADSICEHTLVLLTRLREYVAVNNPGDYTDEAAAEFFAAMERPAALEEQNAAQQQEREPRIVLAPRLILDGGEASLSYRVGYAGSKLLNLRSYADFLRALEARESYAASKTLSLDFSQYTLTPESEPWLTFLQRRMSEVETANDQLARRSNYYYGESGTLKLKTKDLLTGAMLDRFYEQAEGQMVPLQDNASKKEYDIRVGHAALRVQLTTSRLKNRAGKLAGVSVTGQMPNILPGSAGSYMLNRQSLSRITREEADFLKPFRIASDEGGHISFRVGREKLAEFYYRTVPRFLETDWLEFEDTCAEEVENLLPPEPVFTFRLDRDAEAGLLTCEALVVYGDGEPIRLPDDTADGLRDRVQEKRVLELVQSYYPKLEGRRGCFSLSFSEDALYTILTEGIAALSRYGEVQATDAFSATPLRSVPQLRVGVSLESGLLELSVLTKDMSYEDLLAVLQSYRQKKRYHRLSDGALVDLAGENQLGELERMAEDLDVRLEELLNRKKPIPAYRALYLDNLLEQHDALAANRDRAYRGLLKSFKTIRDADYEVPEAQAEILRPYQVYGYKWLRTLTAAGFGGVLADEMGLGKTVQAIALLQALRDAGEEGADLVVSPASLVFNWQEEFSRFAPGLEVAVLAGPPAARRKLLREKAEEGKSVLITSYDLLRQDIAAYENLRFRVMLLDEAQYIKNQKAALTKAVKGVTAAHRLALTGTPIENRLAELWSIFDFLMPGFLYSYAAFSRRFETPIVKQKDADATERLRRMTGPFILRRLKADVLKDLPEKLEEVRYTRFEPAQRKVYDGQVVRMKGLLMNAGNEDRIKIFAELMRIRQICCDPSLLLEDYHEGSAKRAACMELIRSAMGGGHRMLVFSQFTSMLALLEEDLREEGIPYYKLTGSTPKEQRLRLVRAFNEGDTPVFLISLKAGGTGLNLTGADVVIHYDPWWNLAAQNQATDRAHRIGQEKKVTVYRLIVKDTIEEKILALQEAKRDLADSILSGETASLTTLSNEELLALLE